MISKTPGTSKRRHSGLTMLAMVVVMVGSTTAAMAQEYFVVSPPHFPDELYRTAYAMNNYGHIVGDWMPTVGGKLHGFYFDGTAMTDLGVDVHPRDVSDAGYVAGYYTNGGALLYDRNTDAFTPLGTLGGPTAYGFAVNNLGHVAGQSDMSSGPDRAFLYKEGQMINLGTPTNLGTYVTDYTWANALNDNGLVVGEALIGYGGDYWAVPWSFDSSDPDATMLKIAVGSYVSGSAWAMNEAGVITGWHSWNEDLWGDAFTFDGTTFTSLGSLSGTSYSIANAMNNTGEIIGYSFGEWVWQDWCGCLVWTTGIYHPTYFRDGTVINLQSLLPPDAGTLTIPTDINDSGKILAPLSGGSALLVPNITADPDDDGDLDLLDFSLFDDCMTGPDVDPDPTTLLKSDCVRLFDFDMDYDVDWLDFGILQIRLGAPGTIEGEIEYTGSSTGTIHVMAESVSGEGFTYTTSLDEPGPFLIRVWRTGQYNVSAFLDVNGNDVADAGEPSAPSLDNPVWLLEEGGSVSDVWIDLGPYDVTGWVEFENGSPASGVLITATGPVTESSTTQADGSFVVPVALTGDYSITPTDPTRYFYPYERPATIEGTDIHDLAFEAHMLPTGNADGEIKGPVAAVNPAEYTLTIDDAGTLVTLYVYSGTVFEGEAASLEQIAVGYIVEAKYWVPSNLVEKMTTDLPP